MKRGQLYSGMTALTVRFRQTDEEAVFILIHTWLNNGLLVQHRHVGEEVTACFIFSVTFA